MFFLEFLAFKMGGALYSGVKITPRAVRILKELNLFLYSINFVNTHRPSEKRIAEFI